MKRGIGFLLAMVLMGSVLLPVCAEEASQEEIAPAVQTGEEDHTPTECPHAFGAWSDTGNGHSRVCSLCGAAESGSHGWDAGTVTAAPACTEAGTKVFSCGVCGAEKTETIPPAGHTYGDWQQADASGHKRSC